MFDYDGVYDDIQAQRVQPRKEEKLARKSRYTEGLLDKAKEREREQDIVYERKCAAPHTAAHRRNLLKSTARSLELRLLIAQAGEGARGGGPPVRRQGQILDGRVQAQAAGGPEVAGRGAPARGRREARQRRVARPHGRLLPVRPARPCCVISRAIHGAQVTLYKALPNKQNVSSAVGLHDFS